MDTHPFLAAIYASARLHLRKAREAEEHALEAAMYRYEAGARGSRFRELFATWDAKRSLHLARALQERMRASALRFYLRGFEADRAAS